MFRKITVLLVLLVATTLAKWGQDSVEIRPIDYQGNGDFFLPFYMHKKSLSEKMKSLKGRVVSNHLRDTLFG